MLNHDALRDGGDGDVQAPPPRPPHPPHPDDAPDAADAARARDAQDAREVQHANPPRGWAGALDVAQAIADPAGVIERFSRIAARLEQSVARAIRELRQLRADARDADGEEPLPCPYLEIEDEEEGEEQEVDERDLDERDDDEDEDEDDEDEDDEDEDDEDEDDEGEDDEDVDDEGEDDEGEDDEDVDDEGEDDEDEDIDDEDVDDDDAAEDDDDGGAAGVVTSVTMSDRAPDIAQNEPNFARSHAGDDDAGRYDGGSCNIDLPALMRRAAADAAARTGHRRRDLKLA